MAVPPSATPARAVVWTFHGSVPNSPRALYTNRRVSWSRTTRTYDDKKFWRLPNQCIKSIQGENDFSKGLSDRLNPLGSGWSNTKVAATNPSNPLRWPSFSKDMFIEINPGRPATIWAW